MLTMTAIADNSNMIAELLVHQSKKLRATSAYSNSKVKESDSCKDY